MRERFGWEDTAISKQYVEVINGDIETENYYCKHFYHDPFLFSLLPALDGKNVIELGAGNLYLAKKIKEQNPSLGQYFATDLANMLVFANTTEAGVTPVAARAEELPAADKKFDVGIASLLLQWIADKKAVFSESYRVLAQDGVLVLSVVHPDIYRSGNYVERDEQVFFEQTADTSVERVFDVMLSDVIGPVTYFGTPVDSYVRLLSEVGFKEVELFAPTVSNPEIAKLHLGLRKHVHRPLFLFITAKK